jgi:hypothetical protein
MVNMDINKVLILSDKLHVSDDFKALSNEFRDRLLIGYVPYNAIEV